MKPRLHEIFVRHAKGPAEDSMGAAMEDGVSPGSQDGGERGVTP